ncbi:sensor histidine kinase [Planomonospora parontospora]|uniref:sensor histidine kinase n=1 Tax=Planomonospora parontospora TaxID=58119 RepID=UPI00167014BC|nr:histidine kinase [Planomonospora parontospora]GGL06191.1 ATPase [Planomonospora parontospora subsp. antibiotica]GII14227.1 ATPase [Planomonospora parontospora subsp. antibiotica]
MRATMAALAGRAGRTSPHTVDAVLAVALTAFTLLWEANDRSGGWREPDAVSAALTCAANLPVAVRRRAPLTVLLACAAAAAVHHALGYRPSADNFSCLFALYAVVVQRPLPAVLAGAGLATALWWWAGVMAADGAVLLNAAQGLAFSVATCAFGLGNRRLADRNRRLAELTEQLRQEQEDRERRAVTRERVRIARELHDIVAHHISVMSVQAGLGSYVVDSDPRTAREALTTIADTGREAMEELRRLLSLLRVDGGSGDSGSGDGGDRDEEKYASAPGVGRLGPLAERLRTAGVPVDVRITGTARPLPPGLDLCVYRIVQECLTNVLKHAGPARAEVTLAYGADELTVRVTDDGRPPARPGAPRGHGLVGMAERVKLYRGTIGHGPRPDGGFEVVAVFPLSSALGGSRSAAP